MDTDIQGAGAAALMGIYSEEATGARASDEVEPAEFLLEAGR